MAESEKMKVIQGPDDPLYRALVLRIRQHCGPALEHRCTSQDCFRGSESEQSLVSRGILPGPPISSNVFVTRCRAIHLCSERSCSLWNNDPTGTCPVSGIQYGQLVSSYDRNNSRTWYAPTLLPESGSGSVAPAETKPTASKKRALPQPLSQDKKWERASNLLKLLLWSSKRVTRNKQVAGELRALADKMCADYVAEQREQGQLPYWTELFVRRGYALSRTLPLQILEFDEEKHDYYAGILVQVWDRVARFYVRGPRPLNVDAVPQREFDCVALAALYMMRQSDYHREGVALLPHDDFLAAALPPATDLATYFGVQGQLITRGTKYIRQSFENAFADRVPPGEIELDMSKLITKSAKQDTEVGGTITTDAKNRQVKITNSGEVLFMPKARKKD